LDQQKLRDYAEQVLSLDLAEYHYRDAPNGPLELGFIIDDIEPSVAVQRDRVNLYGYLSMAVAALKLQQEQLGALQEEVTRLRGRVETSTRSCEPLSGATCNDDAMCRIAPENRWYR
jgi:hypothetical protein